ncbi:MAG: peptidoglycan recognition family protein [Polyangia bacterium]
MTHTDKLGRWSWDAAPASSSRVSPASAGRLGLCRLRGLRGLGALALGLGLALNLGGCGEAGPEGGILVPPPGAVEDPECPSGAACEWIPAAYRVSDPMKGSYGNYDLADRPRDGLDIRYIVIHTTETSWDGTIKIFQDPTRSASAHYLVRSQDGRIAQFVPTRHVAWHAGNWYFNMHSIGIEHEAESAEGPKWFTDALYRESARLTRHLAARYNIPLDRAHIIGHDEVPGISPARQKAMHWDPGPYWDWDRYMQLVLAKDEGEADPGTADVAVQIRPPYAQNQPKVTYCYGDNGTDCREAPARPANFLYLRQAPDEKAALIVNPYLMDWDGDRMYNWGNKVRTGQVYVRAEQKGEWDAIYYSGQKAWLYNPGRSLTRRVPRMLVTPKMGVASVPVFGVGYPADAAYMPPTKPAVMEKNYEMLPGQKYPLVGRMTGDYYWAKTYAPAYPYTDFVVVKDGTEYYQISFNHRGALVRTSDVDLVASP